MLFLPKKFGIALGAAQVSNSHILAERGETSNEDFLQRLGVNTRYVCTDQQDSLELARSATKHLVTSGVTECDLLLGITQTQRIRFPHLAAQLQGEYFPHSRAPSFDINLGCSGFVYGLIVLNSLASSMGLKSPIMVCADSYSRHARPQTPSELIFSDASVAMAFGPSAQSGLLSVDIGGDGKGVGKLCVGSRQMPDSSELFMDGSAVMLFTMREVPASIGRALERANLSPDEIDVFFFHQASGIVLGELVRKLKIEPSKVFGNLSAVGNTVSCSIPLLLHEFEGKVGLKQGMKILMCGFGVGLSWATCIIQI